MMIMFIFVLVFSGCTQPEVNDVKMDEPTTQTLDKKPSIVDELDLTDKEAAYLEALQNGVC